MPGEVEWQPNLNMAEAIAAARPGDIKVRELDEEFDGWGWYWTAYIDGERVNGGLCAGFHHGIERGKNAIAQYRQQEFLSAHYWDVETACWILRGEVTDTRAV